MKKNSTRGRGHDVDPDNPPLTRARLTRFKRSSDVVPNVVAAYRARRGRPPKGDAPKTQVTLRLDPLIVAHFKRQGRGWQTRINETLLKEVTSSRSRR